MTERSKYADPASDRPQQYRPTRYVLTLQTTSGVDSNHALRGVLKIAKRRFGLRAIAVREVSLDTVGSARG